MPRYAAFFGSLNVGGNRMKMADLAASFSTFGLAEVETLQAAGNMVFRSERVDVDALQADMSAHICSAFNIKSYAVLRDCSGLAQAIDGNPFAASGEPKRVHTLLLEAAITDAGWQALQADHRGHERMARGSRDIFIDFVNGVADSKLTLPFLSKRLGCRGTARNLNTLTKMRERLERA